MTTCCVLVSSPEHEYPDHPENPERFSQFGDWAEKPYSDSLEWLTVVPASIEEVASVHSERMVRAVEVACQQGPGIIDYAPTYVTRSSYIDALNAAGGTLTCTRSVLDGKSDNGFAIVRPPGHHAEPDVPMGFCIFNNIAIAVQAALAGGLQRAMIVDFDAHHGNGTERIFWSEENVAYLSTHQEGIYPGSGWIEEAPHARRRIINIPLPARSGDGVFARVAEEVISPLAGDFKPKMLFVSAGFDSHWRDPLTTLGLSSAGFLSLSRYLVELAKKHCDGKIVFALEGGYSPANITAGVDAVLSALTGIDSVPEVVERSPYLEPDVHTRITELRNWHGFA